MERARQGDGQLVLIIGEPAIGKSRLIEEFHARLRETPHTWIEWSCSQLLLKHTVASELDYAGHILPTLDGAYDLAELIACDLAAKRGDDAAGWAVNVSNVEGCRLFSIPVEASNLAAA